MWDGKFASRSAARCVIENFHAEDFYGEPNVAVEHQSFQESISMKRKLIESFLVLTDCLSRHHCSATCCSVTRLEFYRRQHKSEACRLLAAQRSSLGEFTLTESFQCSSLLTERFQNIQKSAFSASASLSSGSSGSSSGGHSSQDNDVHTHTYVHGGSSDDEHHGYEEPHHVSFIDFNKNSNSIKYIWHSVVSVCGVNNYLRHKLNHKVFLLTRAVDDATLSSSTNQIVREKLISSLISKPFPPLIAPKIVWGLSIRSADSRSFRSENRVNWRL